MLLPTALHYAQALAAVSTIAALVCLVRPAWRARLARDRLRALAILAALALATCYAEDKEGGGGDNPPKPPEPPTPDVQTRVWVSRLHRAGIYFLPFELRLHLPKLTPEKAAPETP